MRESACSKQRPQTQPTINTNMTDFDSTADRIATLSTGDQWPFHYRGYGLSANATGEVWWQAYNGTDRLFLEPTPDDLLEDIWSVKRNGGAIRVTEAGTVIARVETDTGGSNTTYETVYVGELDFSGELLPDGEPGRALPVSPDGLSAGDLWPSVYDGAEYSFNGERFWWANSNTKLRHDFEVPLPHDIVDELKRLRPRGGSFRITPAGDVLTQLPTAESPADVRAQFRDLPREVKRILQLRRDRGDVDMLPVYVGQLDADERPIDVEEPTRLTDPLSEQEAASLEAWAASMGSYDEQDLDEDDHKFGDER